MSSTVFGLVILWGAAALGFIAARISMMKRKHRHKWIVIIERTPTMLEPGLRTQRCDCGAEAVATARWPGGKWHILYTEVPR